MLQKNTWILVGVFAVLVLGLVLLQRYQEQNPTLPESDAPTVPPPTYLFDFTSEAVVSVLIEDADGQRIELQKDGSGIWLLSQPLTLPEGTDQTSITSAVSQLGTIRILNELTNPPGLDVLELDTPAATLTFTLTSGDTTVIQVGGSSPSGNGYYVRVNGSSPKLVDKFVLDRLISFVTTPPLSLPPPLASLPPWTLQLLSHNGGAGRVGNRPLDLPTLLPPSSWKQSPFQMNEA